MEGGPTTPVYPELKGEHETFGGESSGQTDKLVARGRGRGWQHNFFLMT